ncbi:actin-associated protein FAM107A isoform X2 [Gouania willdenowi]|uniref:actin-associated protein FAM107A isoform X2 n=1 Tax=Gouania willdenowi TaxID=441366 RepID=UPI0010564D45|nr:actin-associated protein FAM107A-like isoform X2 [Gouania willdenowi]
MSLSGSFTKDKHPYMELQSSSRGRKTNSTHPQNKNHTKDNRVTADVSSGPSTSSKVSRTHNELHKELLLTHKKGLALSSRSELQQVLERRIRVQSDQHNEQQNRTPLEDVLLRRQQKQKERGTEQDEEVRGEAQLMEFVRVRQNLRKIHSAIHDNTSHS